MRILSVKVAFIFTALGVFVTGSIASARNTTGPSGGLRGLCSYLGTNTLAGEERVIKCGLPILAAAENLKDKLGPDGRAALAQVLQRPSLEKSIVVGAFRIHYDTSGINMPVLLDSLLNPLPGGYVAFVDSVGAIANAVYAFETQGLGYSPPPPDNGAGGGDEYDIYISNLGNLYGVTEWETEVVHKPDGGSTWTSFITIDNDFSFVSPRRNIGLPALRVTLAHEFHHAIQMGGYGLWMGHEYFYEITSTWMEDVVYTTVNDYYNYLPGHFSHPDESFTRFEALGDIQYARCIWGHYVAKRFGRDAMREAWEEIRTVPPLPAMDNALQSHHQTSFRAAFAEWTKWNYFTGTRSDSTYYPEGAFYPQVVQTSVTLLPPFQAGTAPVFALGATYYRVTGRPDTLVLIIANTNFDAANAGNTGPFEFTYYLSNDPRDQTYTLTPIGIYFGYNVSDPGNWLTWFIVGKKVTIASAKVGKPFPNPLIVGSSVTMQIPVSSPGQVTGTLSIFTSSMDLIYSSRLTSTALISGQQAFAWGGMTNKGRVTQSGIYYYVLDLEGQRYSGKFAILRK